MPPEWKAHLANALTALRVVLAPAFAAAVVLAESTPRLRLVAPLLFAVIAISDVADGRVARRYGSTSNVGRTLDHFADIVFLLTALVTNAALGLVPWWVPAAVAGSFLFYVLDSWRRTPIGRPTLIASRVGHAGGVLNYVLVGVLVCNHTAGVGLLPAAVLAKMFWLVPLYSAAAVIARIAGRWEAAAVVPAIPRAE